MAQPGTLFQVDPTALPAPQSASSVSNSSVEVARPAGLLPQVPAGFQVNVFAEGLTRTRWMEEAPNGDILLSRPNWGDILVLRDSDGDGDADVQTTLVGGFNQPHGMAIRPDGLYVADVNHVWRVPYQPGDTVARGPAVALTPTGALGGSAGHTLRSLAFSADGQSFFVGIGSEQNIAVELSPRASIIQFNTDGSNPRIYASGLRNPAGLEVEPTSGVLYASVVERDRMGDDLVPDFLTRIQPSGFYGWPYAYIGSHPQPNFADQRPDLVSQSLVPDVLFEAHSTPIGFTFYTGNQFPDGYAGDAFVALRGSWNATEPRGFMIARVQVENGVPTNAYEAFMTGFQIGEGQPTTVFGRPTTVATASDGSLLVGDDVGGTIYRVRYAPRGDAADNVLNGAGGNDTLPGEGGNDTVFGKDGNDVLYGNQGMDVVYGNLGSDALFGGQGADLLFGGRDADVVYGNLGDDRLFGNAGADILFGGQGNDTLFGGQGSDVLRGTLGDDVLWGNLGDDTLLGGAGADVFAVQTGGGADLVMDFTWAEGDRIGLRSGMSWSVAEGTGGAMVSLGNGDQLALLNVHASEVNGAWFVTT